MSEDRACSVCDRISRSRFLRGYEPTTAREKGMRRMGLITSSGIEIMLHKDWKRPRISDLRGMKEYLRLERRGE